MSSAGDDFATWDASGLNRFDETVGAPPTPAPYDPLRLCVFATIALITCVFGPISLAVFAGIAIAGYANARRAGLRSPSRAAASTAAPTPARRRRGRTGAHSSSR